MRTLEFPGSNRPARILGSHGEKSSSCQRVFRRRRKEVPEELPIHLERGGLPGVAKQDLVNSLSALSKATKSGSVLSRTWSHPRPKESVRFIQDGRLARGKTRDHRW